MQQTDSCKSQVTSEPSHRAHGAPWRKETCIYMFQFLASFLRQVSFSSYFLLDIRLPQSNVCVVPPLRKITWRQTHFPVHSYWNRFFLETHAAFCFQIHFPTEHRRCLPSCHFILQLLFLLVLTAMNCTLSRFAVAAMRWLRAETGAEDIRRRDICFNHFDNWFLHLCWCCSGTSLTQGLFTGWKGQALSFGPQMALSQLFLSVKQMRKKNVSSIKVT